ncbi:anti-sigma factor family protein [Streptomyces daliensis]|uniref:Zf-HC2 domain-containing protein n=1 Tax=Streptomyces daliensis TaxID=299421 RepID=A0A8T4IPZ7_9ACTN|nr:zf-HC2 domain-containing protein [Streptomyces daliensis]
MTSPVEHTDVAAYALGVLDPAEAERFEQHLAGCDRCGAELESLMPLPPLLAEHAEHVAHADPTDDTDHAVPEALGARPAPELLDRLLAETAAERRGRRQRRVWLAAAAFVLVVGGPLAAVGFAGGGDGDGNGSGEPAHVASPAREMYEHGEKIGVVDARTKARATVSLERKDWGTHVALKLGHVRGPLSCELVAVGANGTEQTVTTWSVPEGGYGIPGSKWPEPLYTHGGAAFQREDISRFDVRTLDGRRLASIKV